MPKEKSVRLRLFGDASHNRAFFIVIGQLIIRWANNESFFLRACLKLSGLEHALEAHAGHERRGEHGHVPRGLVAHLVVDAQAAVALQAAERLLDLPAPRLDDEAPAAGGADEFPDDAVAGEQLAAAL